MDRRSATTPPGSTARRGDGDGGVRLITVSSYVAPLRQQGHLSMTSVQASLAALLVWLSVLLGEHVPRLAGLRWWTLAVVLLVVISRCKRRIVLLAICVAGAAAGANAWSNPIITASQPCSGVAHLRTDPVPLFGGTQVVLDMGGQRVKAFAHGTHGGRLAQRSAGESVVVRGTCSPLSGQYARSDRVRHVVGILTVEDVTEHFSEGSLVMRTANRIREAMGEGVAQMNTERRSLFTGLVIGDDRLQTRDMVQRFRNSGLSHLCAASGQNVAYLLALASPWTRRRSPRVKWVVTMAIIGWFIVLTRAEPSVLRAGWMAAVVASNALRRHPMNARVVLAMSVVSLLFVDPMLAWSVGFALSVGATAGLAWLSAPLGKICGGRGILATTLAAQVGTLPISLAVFGSVPVVSLIANPLALPVAGLVMTIGLPLSLIASAVPALVSPVSHALSVPVAWVDGVARVAAGVSPTGHANTALWAQVGLWVARRWWRNKGERPTAVAG